MPCLPRRRPNRPRARKAQPGLPRPGSLSGVCGTNPQSDRRLPTPGPRSSRASGSRLGAGDSDVNLKPRSWPSESSCIRVIVVVMT